MGLNGTDRLGGGLKDSNLVFGWHSSLIYIKSLSFTYVICPDFTLLMSISGQKNVVTLFLLQQIRESKSLGPLE